MKIPSPFSTSKKNNTLKLSIITTTLIISNIISSPNAYSAVTYTATGTYLIDQNGVLLLKNEDLSEAADNDKYKLLHANSSSDNLIFDGLQISQQLKAMQSQFSVSITNGAILTINGSTNATFRAEEIVQGWDQGTYAFTSRYNSSINLNGDVFILVEHDIKDEAAEVGANLLYARNNSTILIGNPTSTSTLWSLAAHPDLISAKN